LIFSLYRRGESSVTLLNFINGQSAAAAQGTAVALGTYHSVALMADSKDPFSPEYAMFTMGRGFHGQLGNNDYENAETPVRVNEVDRDRPIELYRGLPDDIHLAVVTAGSSHSASISRRGELYTWGLASSGELGHGGWTPIEVPVPRMILSLNRTRVVSVCAGANHTLAISEAGQLWSCGRGRHGQLGHGHFHDEGVLTLVDSIRGERIVSAAAGKAHSMALAADGKIFTWGDARHGQLGHQQLAALMQAPNPQPIAIPFPQPIASLEPAKLRPPQRVTAIAAGGDHSMAVTVGGTLLAFGSNKHGQLGTGDFLDRMTPTEVLIAFEKELNSCPLRAMQVQCGTSHSAILVQNRGRMEVRTTGDNSYGQLGLGDRRERVCFRPVEFLLPSSNPGRGMHGKWSEPVGVPARIACICSGDWHNAAITHDGQVFTWGRGDCGQLGHGDDKNSWAPKLLNGFKVVHPDRTLRRNRKQPLKTLLLPAEVMPKHATAAGGLAKLAPSGKGSGGSSSRATRSTRNK
jgi:alpha-tubulin suppressor-like RCC1 family protein